MKKYISLSSVFVVLMFIFSACEDPAAEASQKQTEIKGEDSTSNIQETKKQPRKSPIDSLSRILNQDPNNFNAYVARAKMYIEIGSGQAAANDIYNAMQLDSASAEIRNLKGQLNFMQNKTREARNEWTQCIQLDPQNIDCKMRLAELYIAVQDYKKALELVNEALNIDDKNSQAYYFKGLVIRDLYRDSTLALQYFQKTVDLDPNFAAGLDMMGVMLASMGDTLAKFYYQRALEIEPNNADIYYKLGVFYMNNDDINKALESYTKAIQLNPKDAESYFNLGFMHINLRQFAQARDYFTKAIEARDGKNYRAMYGRGYSFEMLGDVINARKDYRGALQANPIYKPAKEALERLDGLGQ